MYKEKNEFCHRTCGRHSDRFTVPVLLRTRYTTAKAGDTLQKPINDGAVLEVVDNQWKAIVARIMMGQD